MLGNHIAIVPDCAYVAIFFKCLAEKSHEMTFWGTIIINIIYTSTEKPLIT